MYIQLSNYCMEYTIHKYINIKTNNIYIYIHTKLPNYYREYTIHIHKIIQLIIKINIFVNIDNHP
jgi:hypothetical protein